MNEPLIVEMLYNLSHYDISVNKHGIMEFVSAKDANEIMDMLQEYSSRFDDEIDHEDEYPRDPVLCAFEEAYGFYSLRRKIEEEILELEEKEALTDDNDPDNHYVVSTLMRTILNPECTFIYDGLICIHYDLFCVGVMDYDFSVLKDIYAVAEKSTNTEMFERDVLDFCNLSPSAFIIGIDNVQYVADFTVDVQYTQANAGVKFINKSYSEEYRDIEYLWDFGDGHTSNEKNPIHVFASTTDEYNVTLSLLKGGVVINAKEVPMTKSTCSANFNDSQTSQNFQYRFTSASYTSIPDDRITKYVWNFGDGTGDITEYVSSSYTHTFDGSGVYNVKLTIYTDYGCEASYGRNVDVRSLGECCKSNDREREKEKDIYYDYDGTKYKIKSVLRATNFIGFHRICVRTVHYRENKKNEKYSEHKTPIKGLGAKASGELNWRANEDNPCGTRAYMSDVWDYKDKQKSRIQRDAGMNEPFRIEKGAVKSFYKVPAQSGNWNASGIFLHDKPCN